MLKTQPARYGNEPSDFAKVGNRPDCIQPWEDGFRTDGVKNAFEWWYFDTHLNDGSSLVIMFYSKSVFDAKGPLKPMASFEWTTATGKKIETAVEVPISQFSASKHTCDVKIGRNTFSGDLHNYTIHFEKDDLIADIQLTGTIPAWRQANAYTYFGKHDEKYFAWLPSVPEGDVTATISMAGETTHYTGTGYHDHNWGNANMAEIIHHWYWGRAKVGKYNFITANVIAAKKYGYAPLATFLLAENHEIVIGESDMYRHMTFTTKDEYVDELTHKKVAKTVIFEYHNGTRHYRISYHRHKDISKYKMADSFTGLTKVLAKLIRFDGAYLRFTGEVTVEKFAGDQVIESVTEPSAVWELMYFGKNLS